MIMITENDYLNEIELRHVRGVVTTSDLQDVLNGEVNNNKIAKYARDLIQNDSITKQGLSNLVSKLIAIEESATAQLEQMWG